MCEKVDAETLYIHYCAPEHLTSKILRIIHNEVKEFQDNFFAHHVVCAWNNLPPRIYSGASLEKPRHSRLPSDSNFRREFSSAQNNAGMLQFMPKLNISIVEFECYYHFQNAERGYIGYSL